MVAAPKDVEIVSPIASQTGYLANPQRPEEDPENAVDGNDEAAWPVYSSRARNLIALPQRTVFMFRCKPQPQPEVTS